MDNYLHVLSATTILNNKVMNPEEEELGTVKELMIDPNEGRIVYAVLSLGGYLGLVDDKLFPVPWEALNFDVDKCAFILDADTEKLKDAPGFEREQWPENADHEPGWFVDVYGHYGYWPDWMVEKQLPR